MPLDVIRLRDSNLNAIVTGEEFRCSVLLWCASWHQLPAASVPDDDAILAQLAGFGRVIKEWKKVREGALHGWVKCSDGRLYHPAVAEKALEAWARRGEFRRKKEADRVRKSAERSRINESQKIRTIPFCPSDKSALSDGQTEKKNPVSDGNPTENPLRGQGEDREKEKPLVAVANATTPPRVPSKAQQKINFDAKQGIFVNISGEQMAAWHEAYPKLDIDAELSRAEVWYIANPRKRKQNHHRFLVNWFARDHDRMHLGGG